MVSFFFFSFQMICADLELTIVQIVNVEKFESNTFL